MHVPRHSDRLSGPDGSIDVLDPADTVDVMSNGVGVSVDGGAGIAFDSRSLATLRTGATISGFAKGIASRSTGVTSGPRTPSPNFSLKGQKWPPPGCEPK
jgi:hypothetical protein